MASEVVRVEVSDFIATVTLDRPPVNAMSPELSQGIMEAFDSFKDRNDVRVAVLTGAGRCFCAGADLKARSASFEAPRPGAGSAGSRSGRETFYSVMECAVPVIGAINGPALGAGLAIAASCDILIASENALLGLPEINVGLLGGGRHAQRRFGAMKARKMMFTGERLPAAELYRLGVVEKVVPPGDLAKEAHALAQEIAEKAPIAMRLAKRGMNAIEFMTVRDGYRFEQDLTAELSQTEDSKEAALAFVEKRKPVFKGR